MQSMLTRTGSLKELRPRMRISRSRHLLRYYSLLATEFVSWVFMPSANAAISLGSTEPGHKHHQDKEGQYNGNSINAEGKWSTKKTSYSSYHQVTYRAKAYA